MSTLSAVSPDGKLIATGGDDDTIRLWDALSLQELARFPIQGTKKGVLIRAQFSGDGKTLAVEAFAPAHDPHRYRLTSIGEGLAEGAIIAFFVKHLAERCPGWGRDSKRHRHKLVRFAAWLRLSWD